MSRTQLPIANQSDHIVPADFAVSTATLRAVWERQQGLIYERIELIERAAMALRQDSPSQDLRAEARRAAHMLAGSLGMFGFNEASRAAQQLEAVLTGAPPRDTTVLQTLLAHLRDDLRE